MVRRLQSNHKVWGLIDKFEYSREPNRIGLPPHIQDPSRRHRRYILRHLQQEVILQADKGDRFDLRPIRLQEAKGTKEDRV